MRPLCVTLRPTFLRLRSNFLEAHGWILFESCFWFSFIFNRVGFLQSCERRCALFKKSVRCGESIKRGRKIVILSSGVAQWLACWAHNPKVRGSKPRSAIQRTRGGGGIEPLLVSKPRGLKPRPSTRPTHHRSDDHTHEIASPGAGNCNNLPKS